MKRGVRAVNLYCSAEVDGLFRPAAPSGGLARLWQRLGAFFLPESCCLCGSSKLIDTAPDRQQMALCGPCWARLPWLESACPRCAEPLPSSHLCGACLRHPPHFHLSHIPLRYEGEVARWVSSFKYHHHWTAGRLLAQLLAHALFHHYQGGPGGLGPAGADSRLPLPAAHSHPHSHPVIPGWPVGSASKPFFSVWPECLIPVPMHPRRLIQRGYNQAAMLAQDLSRTLGVPWLPQGLFRVRETQAQSELDETQRRLNLNRAFRGRPDLPRHVALVDDVVTTTSTVRACAQALAAAGVERVDVWAVARTP